MYRVKHAVSMVALLLVGVASGCGDEDADLSPESSFQREDSAGVTIISSKRAEWGPGKGWRAGRTARTLALTGDGENRLTTGSVFRMEDGRFLGIDTWSTGQVADQAGPGLYRPDASVLRFAADGTVEDTVMAYPSADMARRSVEGRMLTGLPPFARITTTAVRDPELYVGTGETLEVRVYDFSGRLVRILRGPAPDLTITSEEVEARRRAELEGVEDPEAIAYLTARFEATPLPETKPAYVEMFVDPLGNVWLSPFEGGTGTDDPWTVFGSDGRLLGSVAMPTSIDVLDIDEEYVVAVWRDELDVEYVRLHAIER